MPRGDAAALPGAPPFGGGGRRAGEPPVTEGPGPEARGAEGAAAPSAGRDAAYLVAGQVAASAAGFGLGVVLARALGPEGKGFYDIVVGSASLLMMVLGLSLSSGVFYHTAKQPLDHRRLLALLWGVAAVLACLAAALLAAGRDLPWIAWMLPRGTGGAAALLTGGVLLALYGQTLAKAVAGGMGRFGAYSVSDAVGRLAALAAAVALALAGVRTPVPYLVVFAGAIGVSALALSGMVGRAPVPSRVLPVAAIVGYSFPLYVGNLVQFLNYRLDIFFVKEMVSLRAVGIYTVAVSLAQVLWLVPMALAALVMRQVAAEGSGEAVLARVGEVNRFCLYLGVVSAAGLAGVAWFALGPVFGPGFEASFPPLALLLPGIVLFSPTIILSAYLNGIHRQVYTTWVACGSLTVTIVLNLLLVPRIGVAGAAVASTASYTLSSVVTVALSLRTTPGLSARALFVPHRTDLARGMGLVRGALAGVRAAVRPRRPAGS
ncbi:MAG TPA: polysaccharide biosynthesis C-terminal domain-containing protein [Longimicrobium sp.]|nr:polysaccharide biosynthesis C-terminal domain-containing protein [Longimicrobium sp.]